MENNIKIPVIAKVVFAPTIKEIGVRHEFEQRNIRMLGPKGYNYLPTLGDEMVLSSMEEAIGLGCINKGDEEIKAGEIVIKNDSGAKIRLLNNGDIEINKVRITKKGKIIYGNDSK